jgi:CheY-like chemotaxis protein
MVVKRVLIVEDDPLTAMMEQTIIRDLGHEVTAIALSGEAAIEAVERDAPDLILMDIKLSGELDGTQAALKIRQRHAAPIIFITAYGDKDHSISGELDIPEGYGYIVKPFTEAELVNAIGRILSKDPR